MTVENMRELDVVREEEDGRTLFLVRDMANVRLRDHSPEVALGVNSY